MTAELQAHIADSVARVVYGWCTLEKAMAMAGSILEHRPKVCVELGVYGGRSLIACALALRSVGSGSIVGIDPWSNDAASEGESEEANRNWWANTNLRVPRDCCEQSIEFYNLSDICFTIRARSEHVRKILPEWIDFLHIDGNHTELASVRDVTLWLPRVPSGGLIWFDDTNWATTQKALAMLSERAEKIQSVEVGGQACAMFRVR